MKVFTRESIWEWISTWDADNKKWLADKLIEATKDVSPKSSKLEFPHLPKDWQVSTEVKEMAIGKLPDGMDWDKETDKMWEEIAK